MFEKYQSRWILAKRTAVKQKQYHFSKKRLREIVLFLSNRIDVIPFFIQRWRNKCTTLPLYYTAVPMIRFNIFCVYAWNSFTQRPSVYNRCRCCCLVWRDWGKNNTVQITIKQRYLRLCSTSYVHMVGGICTIFCLLQHEKSFHSWKTNFWKFLDDTHCRNVKCSRWISSTSYLFHLNV